MSTLNTTSPVDNVAIVARFTETELTAKTIPALRLICKELGFRGYSSMNKGQIVTLILSNGERGNVPGKEPRVKGPSMAELKATCKARGLSGYSKCNRAELVTAIENNAKPVHVVKPGSVDWLRSLAREHNVKGRSKLNKLGLINALADTDAAELLIAHGLDNYVPPVRKAREAA